MSGEWKQWRPAIWLVILGIALMLIVSFPLGIILVGGGIGAAVRIEQRRRARR